METIKQMKQQMMKQYGMLDNEVLDNLIAKELKLRNAIKEEIKKAKHNLKRS